MKNSDFVLGTIENVTYYNPSNGFTVLDIDDGEKLLTVVGEIGNFNVGECIKAYGELINHVNFGEQFKAKYAERHLPTSASAILRYLSNGAIKGVGPSTAKKIVDRFGEDTLNVIEKNPSLLSTINGISMNKAMNIADEYRKQFSMREVVLFLSDFNVSYEESLKIYKRFGALTIEKVKANPFFLCSDEIKFSFERADEIATKLGIEKDFIFRIFAGIEYVLKHNLQNGHTCLPKNKHIEISASLLDIDEKQIEEIINDMILSGNLFQVMINEKEFLMLPAYYRAEKFICSRITSMLKFPPIKIKNIDDTVNKIQNKFGFSFEKKQLDAIRFASENGMLILTGGPGTGKTTTLKGIIELFNENGIDYLLTAPTGRAAKRMSEITGEDAKTIHRLLEVEWSDSGKPIFLKNENSPLSTQAVIVDEFSMVDTLLFESLLKALPLGCRLIMVGDSNQLPSIGAGNLLQDLIETNIVPKIELTEIFRQALSSDIVKNAHDILQGKHIEFSKNDTDFYFQQFDDSLSICNVISELVSKRVPNKFNYAPFEDIQVLSPSRKREVGTANINNILQNQLNPPSKSKRELNRISFVLREGDKVIQNKNNYDLEWKRDNGEKGTSIFNGDIGIIEKISHTTQSVFVRFEDKVAEYSFDDADNLELAFAMTVHKSQGSEFKCVIMPIFDVPSPLVFRNILYTAVTRAKELLIIVGNIAEVYKMIDNNKKTKRYTAIKSIMEEE